MTKRLLTAVFLILCFIPLRAQSAQGPKVSVVIPAYNVENYIDECVNSVLNQTYKNLEIIIVDDASTDQTYQKLTLLAAKDKRIKLFKNPKNSGANISRNVAFEHVTGEYTYFLDSDDYLSPDFIEKMLSFSRGQNADVVITLSVLNFAADKKIYAPFFLTETAKKYFNKPDGQSYTPQETLLIINHLPASPWTKFCKTSFLREHDIHFLDERLTYGDSFWTTALIANTDKFYIIKTPPYFLRGRHGSMQHLAGAWERVDKLTDFVTVSSRVYDYLKSKNLFDKGKVNLEALSLRLKINTDKRKYYGELRPLLISMKDDILAHRAAYNSKEISFLKAVLKNETLEGYEKSVRPVSPWVWVITSVAVIILILAALRLYMRRSGSSKSRARR